LSLKCAVNQLSQKSAKGQYGVNSQGQNIQQRIFGQPYSAHSVPFRRIIHPRRFDVPQNVTGRYPRIICQSVLYAPVWCNYPIAPNWSECHSRRTNWCLIYVTMVMTYRMQLMCTATCIQRLFFIDTSHSFMAITFSGD
jgi:hypothetical protein